MQRRLTVLILLAVGALASSASARPTKAAERGPERAAPGAAQADPSPMPIRFRGVGKSPRHDVLRPAPERQPNEPSGKLKKPQRKNQLQKPRRPN